MSKALPLHDGTSIKFLLPGIAELLETRELSVPTYQRSYSWRAEEQVQDFWSDLSNAFKEHGEYFLGAVVLTTDVGGSDRRKVVDGQQRLATTSLLLAAIRDELRSCNLRRKAEIIERDYLAKETLESDGKEPRLTLNHSDNVYFRQIMADLPNPTPELKVASQKLLAEAFAFLKEKVHEFAEASGGEKLLDWVVFLKNRARIGVIEVPTEADAYVIFETLNNRGADLTTADLLKNYLYSQAGQQLELVSEYWVKSFSTLEPSATDAKFTPFLRHYWSSRHGLTREKELYRAIRKGVTSQSATVDFVSKLHGAANIYSALGNAQHDYWTGYGTSPRQDVMLLTRFNLSPNKPLLLAALETFSKEEIQKLLRALVSWSVRGIVLEQMNAGRIEESYCSAARKIRAKEIETVDQLRDHLGNVLPGDSEFKAAFKVLQVKTAWQARYFLQALERTRMGTSEPELVPNEDEAKVNLEHILPRNAKNGDWQSFDKDELEGMVHRLGNMALLSKGKNSKIGNKPFKDKLPIFAASEFLLTSSIARVPDWNAAQIEARQAAFAELAVETWQR
ncbi:DUF262 domain-containing protein [Planobispora siamensis]|uniref:DUF262 domain-containing protein n=1 Tax=Planobispora siamensis TaxID=936338 RepID=A0A8J3WNW1_9ACTN|nr:DUF262 domain-containing protein [Planobispora siamensis]GIH97774.1 hypothetical protein Psi01_84040 [Planobispora siamensis]